MGMGCLQFTRGLQHAAFVAALVVGESQTVAANATRVQSWLQDLWQGGAMISNPHEAPVGAAPVTCRNQAAEEQRVAMLEVGENAELLRA